MADVPDKHSTRTPEAVEPEGGVREREVPPTASLLKRVMASDGIDAVAAILFWKLGTLLVVYVAWSLLPFNTALYNANLRFGDPNPSSFRDALTTWDSQHFLLLAEQGYQEGLLSNAFGPLYPLAIRAANLLTGDSLVSGLLIANLASGVALYLVYDLVKQRWDRRVAFTTLVLLMAFPTAFYLNLLYTEGPFLLLLVVLFYALYKRAYPVAAIAAFLLPLLRVPGLVAIVPMAWVLGGEALAGWNRDLRDGLPRLSDVRWNPNLLYLLAPLAGFAVYLGYMHIELGNAFVAMDTEKLFISDRGLHNLLRPDHILTDLFRTDLSLHGYLDSQMDRVFFVAFVASLPLVYRRVDKPMFLFCAIIGLQPFLGSFMSYTRLMMVAFPLYIAYAGVLASWRPQLLYAAIYPLLMLQALLLAMHSLGNWVA